MEDAAYPLKGRPFPDVNRFGSWALQTRTSHSQIWTTSERPAPEPTRAETARRTTAPYSRVAFVTSEGRLALESEGALPLVPVEGIEPDIMRRAISRKEAILRPSLDRHGRTIILAYVPARPAGAEATEARAPAVFLASLMHMGEAVHQTARSQFGMTKLSARVCAALIETGTLRRASKACGVTYLTAQSEMADIMQAAEVGNQSALICRLAQEWRPGPLDSEEATLLLANTFGLIPRDARIAGLIAMGLAREEAGDRLGVSKWAIKSSCTRIFSILGVAKAPELTRVVIDLLLAAELAASFSGGERA